MITKMLRSARCKKLPELSTPVSSSLDSLEVKEEKIEELESELNSVSVYVVDPQYDPAVEDPL